MALNASRPLLIYALHSGNLYGTERMALATAGGLAGEFDCVIMAPEGPALAEGRRLGFITVAFNGAQDFTRSLWRLLGTRRRVVFFATGVMHSLVCLAANLLRRTRIAHLHMVHGGAEERLSYGRKKHLNGRPVTFVAVSGYVRERLIANGVAVGQIVVIENFLTDERVRKAPRRVPFANRGTPNLIVISRLDAEKRVGLLLEAMQQHPELRRFSVRVFGTGWLQNDLRTQAERSGLPVEFIGFHDDIGSELAKSDLLVHLCPVEPFGLAILESLAARVPVLVPDTGGAGLLVDEGVSGFHFQANSTDALARTILKTDEMPAAKLNEVAGGGLIALRTRYAEQARISDYRTLIEGLFA
jgi:glycosyltransferase involved in cell wall biosynthesis